MTETYGDNKFMYYDGKLIAGLFDGVYSIRPYGHKNNVLLLTDVDGNSDTFSYKFYSSFHIKTNIAKPEFSDLDAVLNLSKMLANKYKKIRETIFDARPPYEVFVILGNDSYVSMNKNKNNAYVKSEVFGMKIPITKSMVKYNSWFSVICGKLVGKDIPYYYITDEDHNIVINKVIKMLE